MSSRPIRIALAGNPNAGKSSLFNLLTGLRQKVGNFPGVTVDRKAGSFALHGGATASLIDLPGLYSLYPEAEDDRIASDVLRLPSHPDHPDRVIVVADATNLRRGLLLLSQVIDLGFPVVLAVNMSDLLEADGVRLDAGKLSKDLGVPVVKISALKKRGINELIQAITATEKPPLRTFFRFPEAFRNAAQTLSKELKLGSDYAGFQALLRPDLFPGTDPEIIAEQQQKMGISDPAGIVENETVVRYDNIGEILVGSLKKSDTARERLTQKVDRALLHPFWGYVIFIAILLLVFQALFAWATWPMNLIDTGFAAAAAWMKATFPPGFVSELLVDGIWSGLNGIVVFIPQIAILFLFIAILEDTGYMSRAVFLMDRIMRPFGFSGRSVIPLIGGMACAVPSIMMARSIPQRKEKLITILVTPLMSCSARIPVYVLLISLFVPDYRIGGFINVQGLVMAGMYLLGFLMALLVAWIIKKVLRGGKAGYFITELPLYRSPRWKNVGLVMLNKCKTFVWEAGKVILLISVLLWVLSTYGPKDKMQAVTDAYEPRIEALQKDSAEKAALTNEYRARKLETSYAGIMGKTIEPVIRPLGFDWKIGICIITSFAAREVFVGTMATLYSAGDPSTADPEGKFAMLRSRMGAEVYEGTQRKVYSPVAAISLLIFYAFAMQCMSTLAVTRKETGSWKMTFIMLFYLTGLAYLSSLLIYQVFG